MKKSILLLLSTLACVATFCQQPTEKTLLWKVTGNQLKEPSYLYGTIHLMCPSDIRMDTIIKDKFSTTKELFLEIKTDDPQMMSEMMKGLKMKDSSTLKNMIGKNLFDSLNTTFKKMTGIPLDLLNNAQPILVVSMLYPSMLGCTPDSWEKAFELLAKQKNIPLKGLEKLSDQMDVLSNIPYKEQAEMLVKTLANIDSSRQVFFRMLEVYKSKDIAALYNLTTSDEDFGDYENALLINRNKSWIPVIIAQSQKMPTFYAFGAAHMAGVNGVINLLRQEGLTVEPVMY